MNEENNKIPLPDEQDAKPMPKKPDFLQGDEWFDVDVSNDFLDFDKPYRPPRYTLERDGVPFADVGEIHIISGKPGNGKTGLMSQLEAATLSGRFGNTVARQVGHKKEGSDEFYEVPTKLLHIDTEQGEDDTIGFKNRVLSMAGIDKEWAKEHFFVLRLRDTDLAKDRWRKILKAIWQIQPTDIFLDGMIDIVEDYNDQKECQPIIRKCMRMATHYDASLWSVLHENPMVDKLVGTLGSITQRKVSEIFAVVKIKQCDLPEKDRRSDLPDIYFKVKQNKARGRDVADWLFQYVTNTGGWGEPKEIEENGAQVLNDREMQFMKEADERLKAFNWTSAGATYTELERYLRKSVSGRRAGDLINIAAEHGIIYKSDKKKYHYNGLKELPKENSQDLPFERSESGEAPY
jgi:hypothetical protein